MTLASRLAYRLPADRSHQYAPKKFTQLNLCACLILKVHPGSTYRRCEKLRMLMPAVREAIGTRGKTLFAARRSFAGRPVVPTLIDGVFHPLAGAAAIRTWQDAAMGGTGMETTGDSAHLVSRAGQRCPLTARSKDGHVNGLDRMVFGKIRLFDDDRRTVRERQQLGETDQWKTAAEPQSARPLRRSRAQGRRIHRRGGTDPRSR